MYTPINYAPNYGYSNPYGYNPFVCKIVESLDIVKSAEIPFNSFGLFMKADNTEVYYKFWNNDGTTRIITYTPMAETKTEDIYKKSLDDITATLSKLSNKIDEISKPNKEVRRNG